MQKHFAGADSRIAAFFRQTMPNMLKTWAGSTRIKYRYRALLGIIG